MNLSKEGEKVDMLFDAVAADLEQLKVETVKLESHLLNLVAAVSVLTADDSQARPEPHREP